MAGRTVFSGTWGGMMALCGAFVVALVLAACGSDPEAAPIPPTRTLVPPTETPVITPLPITPTPTDLPGASSFAPASTPVGARGLPDDFAAALQRAVDDLGASGATSEGVRVLAIERFRWPDETLGCADESADEASEPGGRDGYRILLAAADEVYAYHSAGETGMICAPGDLSPGLSGEPVPPDPIAADMIALVRRAWAAEVGADLDEVDVTGLLSVTWPDTSLGCPRGGGEYAEVAAPGYRIMVRAAEQEAVYHTNIQAFVRCAPDAEVLPDVVRAALALPEAPDN